MFTGDLTSEQGKQDYENYIMNNVRNEINSYTKQTQTNSASTLSSQLGLATPTTTIPVGTISPYGGVSAPANWLLCDGSAVSTTTYAALFAVLSTTYNTGGEPANTFRVPDLRGRVAAGKDNMGGTAASRLTAAGSGITGTTLGNAGGTETHTLTIAQMPYHRHAFTVLGVPGSGNATPNASDNPPVRTGYTEYEGGGLTHQNTQPTIITTYIIKAVADVSNTFGVALAGEAGGMLSGTYPNPSVASINGLAAGGDLTGTYPNPTYKNYSICTSGTRPGSPSVGQQIFETDTSKILIYNGSSWIVVNWIGTWPSFWVSKNSTQSTAGTIVFNSVRENVASNYSTTTGLFTAPVTGIYAFHGQCISITNPSSWKFLKNGSAIQGPTPYHSISGGYLSLTASVSTVLTAGQTMGIYLNVGMWYGDGGDVHNVFSGSLIRPN